MLGGASPATLTPVARAANRGAKTTIVLGPEWIGVNEFGYLIFALMARGRSMLARAAGNQLAARVSIADGRATARGTIALVAFR